VKKVSEFNSIQLFYYYLAFEFHIEMGEIGLGNGNRISYDDSFAWSKIVQVDSNTSRVFVRDTKSTEKISHELVT
jgi:hypothetical protein